MLFSIIFSIIRVLAIGSYNSILYIVLILIEVLLIVLLIKTIDLIDYTIVPSKDILSLIE